MKNILTKINNIVLLLMISSIISIIVGMFFIIWNPNPTTGKIVTTLLWSFLSLLSINGILVIIKNDI